MERILLVEDNKALAKLIGRKIESSLPFEVDIAYSHKEAKLFTRKYTYFMALLDINLPDAPEGEVVDYILDKHIPSIVLSGIMDKAFRKEILKKNIIDYVGKNGIEDINYIIRTIDRLSKNRSHKVMLVDDSMIFRKQMKQMLQNLMFEVYAAAHGEEAVNFLEEHPDIRIVLTDYAMPVMNGLELTREIRKKFSKERLSVFALSGTHDDETSALFLKSGATDYIKKPFSKEEFSCRVNNAIEALENIDAITNYADRDYLTGLYNQRYFFDTVEAYFHHATENSEPFALAMVEIDHFKQTVETYGQDIADRLIVHQSQILMHNTKEGDIVARFDGEQFCVLLKNLSAEMAFSVLERIRQRTETHPLKLEDGRVIPLSVTIGASYDPEDSLQETLNHADMMLYHAQNSGYNRVEG